MGSTHEDFPLMLAFVFVCEDFLGLCSLMLASLVHNNQP